MSFEVLAGAVALAIARSAQTDKPFTPRVEGMENLGEVLKPLQDFLEYWNVDGPHLITIPKFGGLRVGIEAVQWQAKQFAIGTTGALTLRETPHGRGAALDIWPKGFDYYTPWASQPSHIVHRFREQGRIAKTFGFEWGGDWGWDFPHIQIPKWRDLPFPLVNS